MAETDEARQQLDIKSLAPFPDEVAAEFHQAARAAAAPAPTAATAAPPAARPGKERWPVKTGIDDDAERVGKSSGGGAQRGIVTTTVEELIQLPRPADMADIRAYQEDYQDRRAEPVEFVIWQMKADIIAIKKEADGDLHIVLQGDSGETMIAEAPLPKAPFVTTRSPWLDAMKQVRAKIADKLGVSFARAAMVPLDSKYVMPAAPIAIAPSDDGSPPAGDAGVDVFEQIQPFKAKVEPTPVTIVGVGFFDRVHDQMGVAMKNGIELHPILDITFEN